MSSTTPVQCSTNGQFLLWDEPAGNHGNRIIILDWIFVCMNKVPWFLAGKSHRGNCPCIHVLSQLGAVHAMNCAFKAAFVFSCVQTVMIFDHHVLKTPTTCVFVRKCKLFAAFSPIIRTKTADRMKTKALENDEEKKCHTLSVPSAFSGAFLVSTTSENASTSKHLWMKRTQSWQVKTKRKPFLLRFLLSEKH